MEGKYVSDEAYKKGQKFLKKIRLVLLIVGALMLAGGITLIVLGVNKENSIPMGEEGWFDASSAGSGMLAGGIAMVFFGVVAFIASIAITITAHRREIIAYTASSTLPVVGEVAEKVANKGVDIIDKNSEKMGRSFGNVLGGAVGGVKKAWNEASNGANGKKAVVCEQCGYKNDTTDKFCGGCGNKLEAKRYCSNCGKELKANDKFCSSCGNKTE
ncbi:MAG: zinc ribbon domain-containing protein [Clostridia bacterium]|nr:zinc ribbon domain-containing protein [Clostridia bacterium]